MSPELIDKATLQGSVRLIVQLKVGEGAGADAIESAKPLTIEASTETLRALAASPRIERVTEDQPRRPQR